MKFPRCYICSGDLQSQGSANTIEPFWNNFHRFLLYPFKFGPLVFILAMSLLSSLILPRLLSGDILSKLFGAVITLFIVVATTRFAFAIIEDASNGRTTPPSLTLLFQVDQDRLFLRQVAVFILAGILIGFAGYTGNLFIYLFAIGFFTLAMPASILVLAIEKRIIAAINPLLLTQLMLKMGTGYLVLYVFVLILSGGPNVLIEYCYEFIPEKLFVPVYTGVNIYFYLAIAYLMGYSLLQYQRQLGYHAELERGFMESEHTTGVNTKEIQKQVNVLLIEGRYQEAKDILRQAIDRMPTEFQLQLRFNKLLSIMDNKEELADHSSYLIDKLMQANAISKAADVFMNTIQVIPEYKISAPEDMDLLSDHFYVTGQYRIALLLVSQLYKENRNYDKIPEVLLRAARIYAENLNNPERAGSIVKQVLRNNDLSEETKTEALKIHKALTA